MSVVPYILYALIIIFGIRTSYSDIRQGKIWNKDILYGFLASSLMLLFLPSSSYPFILMNLVISFFVGVIFWLLGFWSPGDAKLYAMYSFMVSLLYYSPASFADYPFLMVLVYVFSPFFLVFLLTAALKTGFSEFFGAFFRSLKPERLLETALMVFAIDWAGTMFPYLSSNIFFNLFFVMMVFSVVKRVFGLDNIIFLVVVAAARMIYDKSLSSYVFFYRFIFIVFVMIVFRYAAVDISFRVFSRKKKIRDLKKGDLPAEIIVRSGDEYKKVRMPRFGMDRLIGGMYQQRPEGLTKADIDKIRKAKMRFNSIRVYDMMPFAPFMFAGTLLMLLIKHLLGSV